jgi:hypothetical protein
MKFQDWIKSFDNYGQAVTFNYGGQEQHHTLPGAFVTLIFGFILLLYTMAKGRQMVTKDNASTSYMINIKGLEHMDSPLYFEEHMF